LTMNPTFPFRVQFLLHAHQHDQPYRSAAKTNSITRESPSNAERRTLLPQGDRRSTLLHIFDITAQYASI